MYFNGQQSMFVKMAQTGDCEAMWKKMNDIYGTHTDSTDTQMSLLEQLTKITKNRSEMMESFIANVDNIIGELSLCGTDIDEKVRNGIFTVHY